MYLIFLLFFGGKNLKEQFTNRCFIFDPFGKHLDVYIPELCVQVPYIDNK